MNKLRLYLSSGALIASTWVLLAMAGAMATQIAPLTEDDAHRRAEDLLKQMTVDEKVGQMNQSAGIVLPGLGGGKPDDLIANGKVGSVLWLTVSSKPLYPFGYGLSYTSFKLDHLQLSKASMKPGESTEVEVDVTNTGAVAGDAVAQVYIHQRAGSASRPVRQLKGFRRIALRPGETQTLEFSLGKDELSFWSPQTRAWGVEPGTFDVWAGEDSTASLHAEIVITE